MSLFCESPAASALLHLQWQLRTSSHSEASCGSVLLNCMIFMWMAHAQTHAQTHTLIYIHEHNLFALLRDETLHDSSCIVPASWTRSLLHRCCPGRFSDCLCVTSASGSMCVCVCSSCSSSANQEVGRTGSMSWCPSVPTLRLGPAVVPSPAGWLAGWAPQLKKYVESFTCCRSKSPGGRGRGSVRQDGVESEESGGLSELPQRESSL